MAHAMLQLGGVQMQRISKTITFDGAAGTGAVGSVPIYTVTGEIYVVALIPYCTVNVGSAGAGTLALGVTGATTLFVAATTGTDIDAGEFWINTSPAANGIYVPANTVSPYGLRDIVITDNIIGTVATAALNAGAIRFDLLYIPLSSDGYVS